MFNIIIWGRKIDVKVTYECNKSSEKTKNQDEALLLFEKEFCKDNLKISNQDDIIEFLLKNDKDSFNDKKIDNIFKYVMPRELLVRDNDEKRIVDLICSYKLNLDKDVIIEFENECIKNIFFEK